MFCRDHEATLDQADSTFFDHFERDLGFLLAIHEAQEFVSVGHKRRFAVLAEKNSEKEVMLEVKACCGISNLCAH